MTKIKFIGQTVQSADSRTHTHTDTQTDGTDSITSTADAGGKNVLSSKTLLLSLLLVY